MRPSLPLGLLSLVLLWPAVSGGQTSVGESTGDVYRRLTLVAINDFHGALYERPTRQDPTRAQGGLPWLAGAIDALREDDPDLLVVDGGDLFQGSWPVNATQGRGSVDAAHLLGVDVSCIGNHEFDYGPSPANAGLRGALEDAAQRAEFAWLTANVYSDEGERWSPPGIHPWAMIDRAGVRVGFVGLTTVDTPQTTMSRHVTDLRFTDPVAAVNQWAPWLRSKGADVVVVVGHIGGACREADCAPSGELQLLLDGLPEGLVDVYVLGHDHERMARRFGDSFVVSSSSYGRALSRVELAVGPDGFDADASVLYPTWDLLHDTVDPGCGGGAFPLGPLDVGGRTIEPSAEAVALVREIEAEGGTLCEQVGCAARALGRNSDGESEVGNFVTDAMLAAFEGADVAIANAGGLRANISQGPLLREHLHAVMPFDNRLMLVEMTGAQLALLLRIGASGAHGIFHAGGVQYRLDPLATDGTDLNGDGQVEEWETVRLCGVSSVAGEAFRPDRIYRVVVTDFLYTGGDHTSPAFAGTTVLDEGAFLRDALYAYSQGLGECIGLNTGVIDPAAPRIVLGACGE